MIEEPSSVSAPKLLDQVWGKIRLKHYSLRTEQTYVDWIKRFILFHGKLHPRDLGARHVEAFPMDLAVGRNVLASTQNQALAVLIYTHVLNRGGRGVESPLDRL